MFPVGEPRVGKGPRVRRFPYIIMHIAQPKHPIPDDEMYMESLVFSLEPYPASKVLADYCKVKKMEASKFHCHPVVFSKDMRREGAGTLCIRRDGDVFRGGINWRR